MAVILSLSYGVRKACLKTEPQLYFCIAKWCAKAASLANWDSFQVVLMIFRFVANSRSA